MLEGRPFGQFISFHIISMNAAEYLRKSTDTEDRQILSKEGQQQENVRRAKLNGDEIKWSYSDSGSAKRPGTRRDFKLLVSDIHSGKVKKVYIWALSRLARNPVEAGEIQWLLQEGILEAIVTKDKIYLPTDNVLQMAVEMGMATQYSLDLSKDVKRGMLQKAKLGWRPGRACIGYMNDYAGLKGEKKIMQDPDRFAIMRECWNLLLTGAYTVPQIHRKATKELGFTIRGNRTEQARPLGLTTLYQAFSNPFYFGEFDWDGETYQGGHEPMITRDEFERAQMILGGRGKPRQRRYLNNYAGLIRCGCCGAMIVVNVVEKKLKITGEYQRYRFYRCGHNRKIVVCTQKGCTREKDLEEQFRATIDRVTIPQAFIEWALTELKATQQDRSEQHQSTLASHQHAYADIIGKIDTLVDRQLSEVTRLPEDYFQTKLKNFESEKTRLAAIIQDFDASTSQWTQDIINHLNFTLHLRERFDSPDTSREQRLEILHALGQSVQLMDGLLDFGFTEKFEALVMGKVAMAEAISPLQLDEELDIPLADVKKETLERVSSAWSG